MGAKLDQRIHAQYTSLSPQMRRAAQFVMEHPEKVAMHSMRSLSSVAGVAPPTFTRFAQQLGYDGFDDVRSECQNDVEARGSISARAARLIRESDESQPFLNRMGAASIANIEAIMGRLDGEQIKSAVEMIYEAEHVFVVGALSSSGMAEYFGYLLSWLRENSVVAGQNGVSMGAAMSTLNPQDVVVVITMHPYAKRSISAAKRAHDHGAKVIVITDDISSPALEFASSGFILRTESPQFFSSYVTTLVLIEALVGALVARGGNTAMARIAKVEESNRRIGEYHDGTNQT